ncbi:MAG: sulfur carrier protein ThiS [Wujia sp.]
MITLNGSNCPQANGMNVIDLLKQEGYPTRLIAVECNGQIIPKNEYENHRFSDGDTIEVVRFVGGG